MRLVIDTNVIVGAVIKLTSVPNLVLQLACRHHTILTSRDTEHELRRVLQSGKLSHLIKPSTMTWIDRVLLASELVAVNQTFAACRDKSDDKFLDLAINGHADLIISGDADLLALGAFHDIPVIVPVTFLRDYYPGRAP